MLRNWAPAKGRSGLETSKDFISRDHKNRQWGCFRIEYCHSDVILDPLGGAEKLEKMYTKGLLTCLHDIPATLSKNVQKLYFSQVPLWWSILKWVLLQKFVGLFISILIPILRYGRNVFKRSKSFQCSNYEISWFIWVSWHFLILSNKYKDFFYLERHAICWSGYVISEHPRLLLFAALRQ